MKTTTFFGVEISKKTEKRFCIEEYSFFVVYGKNPLRFINIDDNEEIKSLGRVKKGFKVKENGISSAIKLKKDNGMERSLGKNEIISKPGSYTVSVLAPTGDLYSSIIKVDDGLTYSELSARIYEEENNKKGYTTNKNINRSPFAKIRIAQKDGISIKKAKVKNRDGYGITGESLDFFLDFDEKAIDKWQITPDKYGKKENEKVVDVKTGEIDTGALIIKKSYDGRKWINIDRKTYANGLFSTDLYNQYSNQGEVKIYSPSGKEIINGNYYQVIFAYALKEKKGHSKKRCLEKYEFYVCSDELGAVTFHNLTVKEKDFLNGDEDELTVKMYKSAESMGNKAVTVTGFSIDTTNNPTVNINVEKNGKSLAMPKKKTFFDNGKYTIKLKSAVGSEKIVELYVDKRSKADTLKQYFGNAFISGKRIYSEGDYPRFEGGLTSYHFAAISDDMPALYGEIINNSTGIKTSIVGQRTEITRTINEAGSYTVVLNDNETYKTNPSGDNKEITFRFEIIEQGTAPGPVVNKKNLEEAMKKHMAGLRQKYYGLMYSSAGGGFITLAFATKDAALDYARKYEPSTVEIQSDGTYLYTGSFNIEQKTKYESAWDLTDAINYFAEKAVRELYFDITKESTYITIRDKELDGVDNPRTLELDRSAIIFADGQRDLLYDSSKLPVLNDLGYAYIKPGKNEVLDIGAEPFIFIKDKYGCDSNSVIIKDKGGNEYPIEYNRGVQEQLEKMGCETGPVKVIETTVYGDSNVYDAVYFAGQDNSAEITVSYINGEDEKSINMKQGKVEDIEADLFSIKTLSDEIGEYDLIIVSDDNNNSYSYLPEELDKCVFSDAGTYNVSIVNAIGNSFGFKVNITGSEFATISFSGDGTEGFESIIVKKGETNIILPEPDIKGFEFKGYSDEDGNVFHSPIEEIDFIGSKILSPYWSAKEVEIGFYDSQGVLLDNKITKYGSEIILPDYEAPEGFVFDGWRYKGDLITSESFVINEEDIVFTASISENNSDENRGGVHDNISSENIINNEMDVNAYIINNIWIIFSCVAIFVLVLLIMIIRVSKNNKKLKKRLASELTQDGLPDNKYIDQYKKELIEGGEGTDEIPKE